MYADLTLTAHTAALMLDESAAVGRTLAPLASTVELSADAAGALAAGADLVAAHTTAAAATLDFLGDLTAVLEADADRLYRVAFTLLATDADASRRVAPMAGSAPNLTIRPDAVAGSTRMLGTRRAGFGGEMTGR